LLVNKDNYRAIRFYEKNGFATHRRGREPGFRHPGEPDALGSGGLRPGGKFASLACRSAPTPI